MKFPLLTLLLLSLLPFQKNYASEITSPWQNESELAIVQVGGNTESESYSAKQLTRYQWSDYALSGRGRYLSTQNNGTKSALSWEASLRGERIYSPQWSSFLQHGAESDIFAGYIQRDNSDLGAKYNFDTQTKTRILSSEFGLRFRQSQNINEPEKRQSLSGLLYFQYTESWSENLSSNFWIEYSPNFTQTQDWLLNLEPSMSVMINKVFSLKVAYLLKYHNELKTLNEKYYDTTFTTSLVAKF